MWTTGSCCAIIAAALLLAPDLGLANDAVSGGTGRAELLGSPVMIGVPGADTASSLSVGWSAYEVVGDQAYFVVEGGQLERPGQLWRTDGTAESTVMVTDRVRTSNDDPIQQMAAVGEELYFTGEDRKHGVELWRTDGTDQGTALVADLHPGTGNSYPSDIVALDDTTLFWARFPAAACGLWRTDGTPAGTLMIRSIRDFGIRPPDMNYCPNPDVAMRVGDDLLLSISRGHRRLWRSDGTAEGTALVHAFPRKSITEWVQAADGRVYFAADDGEHGSELWRTDGTASGTELVADVARGPASANPEPVAAGGGAIYFLADAPRGGRALWVTDGTAPGTSLVKKLAANWSYGFEAGDESLYFWADDGRHGSELWRSDGTPQGTRMVRDIAPGRKSAGPMGYTEIITIGDLAIFAANDRAHGTELWASDGTHGGTQMLADIGPGTGGVGPGWAKPLDGLVLFSADDGRHGRELWRSDGTPEGTELVRDIGVSMASVEVFGATAVGEDLAYLGSRDGRGAPLTWIDGATGQARQLANITRGEISYEVASLGAEIVFAGASTRHGAEPWVSDGTRPGTRMLKDIDRGRASDFCATRAGCGTHPADSGPDSFVTIGEVTYFTAGDESRGRELWRTDGTPAGTRLVKDIGPGRKSGVQGRALAGVGDVLYFAADDGRHGSELWRSDGTTAGTRMVKDIGPGWSVAWWDAPVPSGSGDLVYFRAETNKTGLELWVTDGTAAGTNLVKDIRPGPKASKPEDLTAVGDLLYFTAADGTHGRELWRTDGTAEGTALVADLASGKGGSRLGELVALEDELLFAVWDGPGELVIPGTLYRTDGTEAGTQPFGPVQDDVEALRRRWSEFPASAVAGGRLFFAADDGIHGLELWSTDGTPGGTGLIADLSPGPTGSAPEWLLAADGYLYFTADDGVNGRQLWQLRVTEA